MTKVTTWSCGSKQTCTWFQRFHFKEQIDIKTWSIQPFIGIYCIPYLVWHKDILQYMYNLLSFFFLWKNRRNERAPEGGFLFGEQGDRKCRARDRMCDKPLKQWVTLPGACAEHWTCKSRGLRRRRGVERVEEVSKESEVEEPTQQKKANVGGVPKELLNVLILYNAPSL